MVGFDPEHDPPPFPLNPPLFTLAHSHLPPPERPGTLTPPIYSPATVPFRWEESPGKPKSCTAIITAAADFSRKSLDLPPRLLTNQSPPTAALDAARSKYQFQSSSFRMVAGECYGSFRDGSGSPEPAPYGALVVSRRGVRGKEKRKGLLGYWKRRALKGKREAGGGSYVFPSSADREIGCIYGEEGEDEDGIRSGTSVKVTRIGSFSLASSSCAKSGFWAGMYEGLKQAVPWRTKKAKKSIIPK